ncbi:MAG: hypothetical protein A2351_02285 [Omnitrophica bacterium RIFOXYB12_FULL_50_7]|nr:MAG: hypothetical protein A2351_02285 [Omnitrophica bacterium RIFOXYB12_FULL_50_7]
MRTPRTVYWIILFACTFFGGIGVLQAGSGYEVKCKDPKCGFKTHAGIGGGMAFESAAGFCPKCQEWVSLSWKRGEKAPAPFAEFSDPKTGETRRLYKCPKCKQPFVVIEKIEDMKFCPRCKKPTLENKRAVFYD